MMDLPILSGDLWGQWGGAFTSAPRASVAHRKLVLDVGHAPSGPDAGLHESLGL